MKCQKCGSEITQKQIDEGNYREGYGGDYHEMCPTKCFVCDEEIESLAGATKSMAGAWRHKTCQPNKVQIPPAPQEEDFDKEAFAKRIIKRRR